MALENLEEQAEATRKAWNLRRTKLRRTAKSGVVRVTVNGHLRVVRLQLEDGALDNVAALEKALCVAVNKATDAAQAAREKVEGKPAFGPMMEYMFDF